MCKKLCQSVVGLYPYQMHIELLQTVEHTVDASLDMSNILSTAHPCCYSTNPCCHATNLGCYSINSDQINKRQYCFNL